MGAGMEIRCGSCGAANDEGQRFCTYCGSPLNEGASPQQGGQEPQVKSRTPATIEELKQWYTDRKLPPEDVTRFFIGKDVKEPKAFGIYREGDEVVVYKNKANGERAVRYRGTDEAFAVSELLSRLKEEILRQKSSHGKGVSRSKASSIGNIIPYVLSAAAIIIFLIIAANDKSPKRGYYRYNDRDYYYQDGWYYYDPYYDGWYTAYEDIIPAIDKDNASQYSYNGSGFEDSEWYSDSDSDSDSSYDWDGGDWDSGGGDWDSDW